MVARGGGLAVVVAMLAGIALGLGAAPSHAVDPLEGLEISAKRIGWDGIELGLSYVQAERRFGTTLPLTERPEERCGRFASKVERNGLLLQVGFPSSKPGAKIETLFVRFEGEQIAADSAALVAALRARVPDARFRPDDGRPGVTEAGHPSPSFEIVRGEETFLVQLQPREGILLARRGCLP